MSVWSLNLSEQIQTDINMSLSLMSNLMRCVWRLKMHLIVDIICIITWPLQSLCDDDNNKGFFN